MLREPGMRLLKGAVFVLGLLPFAWLAWLTWQQQLGPEPVETLTHGTGDWALRFLLLTLAMTPARHLTGRAEFIRLRRMLGLYAFFYLCLHFAIYLGLEHAFDWGEIQRDILKRPYVTVGFAAWLLMIPLALTSTQGMMRRLGRRWKVLHRLVYVIAILAVLHFLWLVKADLREPLLYAAVLAVLLGLRLRWQPLRARRFR